MDAPQGSPQQAQPVFSCNEKQAVEGLLDLGSKRKQEYKNRTTTNALRNKKTWIERAKALPNITERHKRARLDYKGIPISKPSRGGLSFKNQVIAYVLEEAEKNKHIKITMAPEGEPCAYGGIKEIMVYKEHSLSFARELLGTFGFRFDEDMFQAKDMHLGLDKEDRELHKVSENSMPKKDRTTAIRGWQGPNYKDFQNAMGSTSKSTFGLSPCSDQRTSKWIDWLHGEIPAIHKPSKRVWWIK